MKTATADAAVHELTVAEVGRLKSAFASQRQTAMERRAQLYASRNPEAATDELMTDDDRATRELARELLNGWSPAHFSTPPTLSEDQRLKREISALDLVLTALDQKEIVARAAASASWAIQNEDEWTATCRETLLCAERLMSLEQKLRQMRLQLGGVTPSTLPGATVFGTGRSILSGGGSDPVSSARIRALVDGIVTQKQIEDARHHV